MSNGFGQYESARTGPKVDLEDGIYSALVREAELVRDEKGAPVESYGKKQVVVRFMVDRDIELRRKYSISYGQNKENGKWAAWASFIEAATGIKCGSPEQKDIGPGDLENIEVRIMVKENDRGYMDIVDVLQPRKKATPATRGNDLPARARANAVVARARGMEEPMGAGEPTEDEINEALAQSAAKDALYDGLEDETPY